MVPVVVSVVVVLLSSGGASSGALSRGDLSASLGVIPSGSPAPAGNFVPSLGSLESLKEPGPKEVPGSPRKARKLPIYIGKFRAFWSARQKSKFHHGQHALKVLQRSDNSKF